jgi:hypothetical protein
MCCIARTRFGSLSRWSNGTNSFRNRKALREAVAVGPVSYYQPGPFGGNETRDGTIYVEGPHYPAPHRWYAACEVKDGVIVKVK